MSHTTELMIKSHNTAVDTLGESWAQYLGSEFSQEYMAIISATLRRERQTHTIYPSQEDVFKAYKTTPYKKVRVVILGQDPYHNGAADGLAFSSKHDTFIPASLRNIFKEIGYKSVKSPNLMRWAQQGVLLLNTCLTVRKGLAGSHSKIGWQKFTFRTIQSLNKIDEPIIFMLWGSHAQKYEEYIDSNHIILKCSHPSPFSAHRGFLGCGHFKWVNDYFKQTNQPVIDW
jgi:uracil-DNA glycosylase